MIFVEEKDGSNYNDAITEEMIEDVLIDIGIPTSLFGFDYIKDAVLILGRDNGKVKWTALYSEIAKKNGKTMHQIERSIRHALEIARNLKVDYETVNHYIGFANTNNSSSISLLYRTMKRDMRNSYHNRKDSLNISSIDEQRVKEIVKKTIKEMLGDVCGK